MAANVLDNLANWSTTDSSNQPDGSDAADIDAELRRIQSVVRKYTRTIGANIASSSTVDLSAATGDVITVTGTTTITGLGTVSAGMRFWLVFSGALTLTHNGTSLILPGATNITTIAGDVACFESLGSGNWMCLAYTKNSTPTVYALPGANSDITSLSGLTTPLSIAQGGTAGTTQATALTAMGAVLNGVLGKSGTYPVVEADRGKLIDCTNTLTLTLPAVATAGDGFVIGVKNSTIADVVTIDPNASELIDGASTLTLAAGESCLVVCTGAAWKTVGKSGLYTVSTGASGSAIDFTGIPSTAKKITVSLYGFSTNVVGSNFAVRIGDSGGFATTGYVSRAGYITTTPSYGDSGTQTSNFYCGQNPLTADLLTGSLTLIKGSGNTWIADGCFIRESASLGASYQCAGRCSLSNVLDRVRVTTTGGDTFNAGTATIQYE